MAGHCQWVLLGQLLMVFPPWRSLPWEVTCLLDNYLRALSLFSTSVPNPGPQDVPTAVHSLGYLTENQDWLTHPSAIKWGPWLHQQTIVLSSIWLPWVFVSVLSFPQGSSLEAWDQACIQSGFSVIEAIIWDADDTMGVGVGPCAGPWVAGISVGRGKINKETHRTVGHNSLLVWKSGQECI